MNGRKKPPIAVGTGKSSIGAMIDFGAVLKKDQPALLVTGYDEQIFNYSRPSPTSHSVPCGQDIDIPNLPGTYCIGP